MSMSNGIIYYNYGSKCAVRLLVSIESLKKFYSGDITIISDGQESDNICSVIAKSTGCKMLSMKNSGVPNGKNYALLVRTRLNLFTPYDWTVYLDADTLVTGNISELFDQSAPFVATQFCRWKTSGRKISGRIEGFRKVCPELVDPALKFGPAVNCGVWAFKKNASIFNDWYRTAIKNVDSFIPDEVACQLLLPKHNHRIVDCRYNYSCKYGPEDITDYRIIHYHGRKHCREGNKYMSGLWLAAYDEVIRKNIANVADWTPSGDRMLERYLKARGKYDETK